MDSGRRPILFASLPASGLMNSLLVLCGELARRGVADLWFATDEHRRTIVEKIPGRTPVEFASLGELIPELSAAWGDDIYRAVTQRSRFKAHKAIIQATYRPSLQAVKYRRLEEAVDKIEPALMVIDATSAFALDLAEARKIPYVLSMPYLPSNALVPHNPLAKTDVPKNFPVPHSGLPLKMSFGQRMNNRMFKLRTLAMFLNPAMGKLLAEDGKIRKELGLAPANPITKVEAAELVLCYSVAGLDYPFPMPEKVWQVGALVPPLPEAPPNELTTWLDQHDDVVYIGLGTVTRLNRDQVRALVEVARRLEGRNHVLWKLPVQQQEFLPPRETLPANLRIEDWVPSQLDVLAHRNVRLFVTHAGANGFFEGLHFGKPMVVLPLWLDCYDQAARGQDAGVSLTLDRPYAIEADDVMDKVDRVLSDPSFRETAERFARLNREAGGLATAADLVLDLPALAK